VDAPAGTDIDAKLRAIARDFGSALQRLARGYEADAARQQDLVQDILVAIWRALPGFEERASLRTWVLRVAHNVAVSHVIKGRRDRLGRAVAVDEAMLVVDAAREVEGRDGASRLAAMIRALRPADAQVILLYLEGLEYAEIADVTGLTRENVGVKVHRIKAALARGLEERGGA
jgi:RNA polymerase sigma-70 factor (ECF subfamily)